jgi:hypothetical protein
MKKEKRQHMERQNGELIREGTLSLNVLQADAEAGW